MVSIFAGKWKLRCGSTCMASLPLRVFFRLRCGCRHGASIDLSPTVIWESLRATFAF